MATDIHCTDHTDRSESRDPNHTDFTDHMKFSDECKSYLSEPTASSSLYTESEFAAWSLYGPDFLELVHNTHNLEFKRPYHRAELVNKDIHPHAEGAYVVYSCIEVWGDSLPPNYNHISLFYDRLFVDAGWNNYMSELNAFLYGSDLASKLTCMLTPYSKWTYNVRLVDCPLRWLCNALKQIALKHSLPAQEILQWPFSSSDAWDDAMHDAYHLTWSPV